MKGDVAIDVCGRLHLLVALRSHARPLRFGACYVHLADWRHESTGRGGLASREWENNTAACAFESDKPSSCRSVSAQLSWSDMALLHACASLAPSWHASCSVASHMRAFLRLPASLVHYRPHYFRTGARGGRALPGCRPLPCMGPCAYWLMWRDPGQEMQDALRLMWWSAYATGLREAIASYSCMCRI